MRTATQLSGIFVSQVLGKSLPDIVTAVTDEWIEVAPDRVIETLLWLLDSDEFDAAQLSNLTAVDRHTHIEVIYHLQSLDLNHQLVVKTRTHGMDPAVVQSAYPVYKGALLQEREVYDLMGVRFEGHPDLRRLFLWDGFPGHPLRKDFLAMPGRITPGLEGFPFEDKDKPIRPINQENVEAGVAYVVTGETDENRAETDLSEGRG
ncbi:MAG TPA: NADH-quinone oxidoreductase subunit C [Dehalococcoidia bacterium]|nr:NADH-quinone oxidoreductase subunit C [Dehalococcoidia bacterium]